MIIIVEVLQGGCRLEGPSSSERITPVRSHDGGPPLRDGLRVDGSREYQRVHQGQSGCEPV